MKKTSEIIPIVTGISFCLLFLLAAVFRVNPESIDIQLHDIYFVTSYSQFFYALAFYFFIFSSQYFMLSSWLAGGKKNTFQYIHLIGSILCMLMIFCPLMVVKWEQVPRRYYTFSNFETFNSFNLLTLFISIAAILFFFINIAFLLYYLFCLMRKFTSAWRQS